MRRSTVVKIFVGSLIGAVPALVLLIVNNARADPPQGTR